MNVWVFSCNWFQTISRYTLPHVQCLLGLGQAPGVHPALVASKSQDILIDKPYLTTDIHTYGQFVVFNYLTCMFWEFRRLK